jgi:cyclophilin family peptidyl-prolyl cis-trans isomerase|uniref:PPIase cyclophilin-type domain-containing protein n=1 Tax=Phaeodactylum tricornutum TaxID=2850 RepID=A0A8J9SX81_PHATR
MVAKHKRSMQSPTHHVNGAEIVLPQHGYAPGKSPLNMKSDSSGSSEDTVSTRETFWIGALHDSEEMQLPTWSGNPQSPLDGGHSSRNTLLFTAHKRNFSAPLFLIAFVLVGLAAMVTSRITVNDASEQVSLLTTNRAKMNLQLQKSQKDMLSLKRKISAMDAMIQQQQGMDTNASSSGAIQQRALEEVNSLQESLTFLGKHSEALKKQVQSMSLKSLEDSYGSLIQRVEVELQFPDHKVGPHKFVIELAPIEVMPHSVDVFLRMVSTHLLDGCSFILNALHVVKAAPLPYDGSSAADKAKAFTEHGLESVAFREYNADYPHKQYTVGFAADGSPSFYINTEDNSEIHIGDPCFGRIVEGFDTIRRLEASPTRNGIWFEKRIGIKRARIL